MQKNSTDKVMLNVAPPKGRLGDKVYNLLAGIGYGCPEDYNATRKLVVENPAAGIRYFLVKPSDVAIYVEHGAADVGIVGKDILTEAEADVYELLDTGLGKCRMCVAAPADYQDDPGRPVRVATKFVNIAKAYYASQGRDIDIIKLNGSIELAPILGLSDVIVDIVETGTTLRENGLKVVTEFCPSRPGSLPTRRATSSSTLKWTPCWKSCGRSCRTRRKQNDQAVQLRRAEARRDPEPRHPRREERGGRGGRHHCRCACPGRRGPEGLRPEI